MTKYHIVFATLDIWSQELKNFFRPELTTTNGVITHFQTISNLQVNTTITYGNEIKLKGIADSLNTWTDSDSTSWKKTKIWTSSTMIIILFIGGAIVAVIWTRRRKEIAAKKRSPGIRIATISSSPPLQRHQLSLGVAECSV
jgi:uncharacterized membrane protein YoaK (UPF0700 family)